ncbi:hypothetical protein ACOME3_001539 [Neoechinorhynchus agilis]
MFSTQRSIMATHSSSSTSKSLFYPKRSTVQQPETPTCAKCNKAAYAAETVSAAGKRYHKLCLKCAICGRLLDSRSISEHNNSLYCKNCYQKQFGLHGKVFLQQKKAEHLLTLSNSTDSISSLSKHNLYKSIGNGVCMRRNKDGTSDQYTRLTNTAIGLAALVMGDKCARCSKMVYLAEKVNAAGKV